MIKRILQLTAAGFRSRWVLAILLALLFGAGLAIPMNPGAQAFQEPFPTPGPRRTRFPPTPTPTFFPFASPTPRLSPTPRPSPTAAILPTSTPGPAGIITIPTARNPVQLDGRCGFQEYSDAYVATFVDGNNTDGRVFIKHTDSTLFVCMVGAQGTYAARFASVYLDPDNRRESMPFPDDLSLRVGITDGILTGLSGGGFPGAYLPAQLSGWTAQSLNSGQGENGTQAISTDQAEFRIPLALASICGAPFSIAVYHHWFASVSNDYGWPQSQYWDQPQTWAVVRLEGAANTGCTYLPVVGR
jgi:hypothetical protein